MNRKIVLLTLPLVFLLSAMTVTSVTAQLRIPGVAAGDWFKYGTLEVNWDSNDPNATFPPSGWEFLEDLNKTEWALISVEDVSGTNVTIRSTSHFKNGTEKIESGYVDIDTGESGETDMSLVAISANLNVNDTFYTSGTYSTWKINETIVRTYPDGVRETNLLNMTYEFSWTVNEIHYYYYFTMHVYWDKSTGIVVEDYYEEINRTGEYLTTWSALSSITESNVWVVPEFPTTTSLLILVLLTAAITVYKRRLLRMPIH